MAFVYLATTTPLTMTSPSQFRPGPPPSVTSDRYTKDYNEVKAKGSTLSHPAAGGCPAPADTDMARFWSGNFGAQWNQVARDMAIDRQLGHRRHGALAGARESRRQPTPPSPCGTASIHYNYWRPITAIHNGAARRQRQDGRRHELGCRSLAVAHFPTTPAQSQTPPYPDYVSGANGLTGAFTAMLQLFFHTDNAPIEVYKAVPASVAICTNPRLYRRISDAAEEVVEARILLGIHFRFADTAARTLGTRVAWHAFTNELRPLRPGWHDFGSHDD